MLRKLALKLQETFHAVQYYFELTFLALSTNYNFVYTMFAMQFEVTTFSEQRRKKWNQLPLQQKLLEKFQEVQNLNLTFGQSL